MQVHNDDRPTPAAANHLAGLFARLSTEQISAFGSILALGSNATNQKVLDIVDETQQPELYQYLKQFLENHVFSFEGGGNCRNFVFYNINDDETFILKLENRLGTPQEVDRYVREKVISDVITENYYEVDCTYTNHHGDQVSGSIILTEYCENSSLEAVVTSQLDPRERLTYGINFYIQMARVLGRVSAGNIFFSDMKNSNWLIDAKYRLRIADTKSFLYTTADGVFSLKLDANKGYHLLRTEQYLIPEFVLEPSFSADKAHVAMFGLDIYQFMTACKANDLEFMRMDFDKDCFKNALGERICRLIERSTKRIPDERPSMTEVIAELESIEAVNRIQNECIDILDAIWDDAMDDDDELIRDYLRGSATRIYASAAIDELDNIKLDLTSIAQQFADNTDISNMFKITQQELKSAHNLPQDLLATIKQMRENILNVPLANRSNDSSQVVELKAQLTNLKNCIEITRGCQELLTTIQEFKINAKDIQMEKFIAKMQSRLCLANSVNDFALIHADLEQALACLQIAQELVSNIQSVADNLVRQSTMFKPNKVRKAHEIEAALLAVPVMERIDILVSDSEQCQSLRNIIAGRGTALGISHAHNATAQDLSKWLDPNLIEKASIVRSTFTKTIEQSRDLDNAENSVNEQEEQTRNAPRN